MGFSWTESKGEGRNIGLFIVLFIIFAVLVCNTFFWQEDAGVVSAVLASIFTGILAYFANEMSAAKDREIAKDDNDKYIKTLVDAILCEIMAGASRMKTIWDTANTNETVKAKFVKSFDVHTNQQFLLPLAQVQDQSIDDALIVEIDISLLKFSQSKIYTTVWDSAARDLAGMVNTEYFNLIHNCYMRFSYVNINMDQAFKEQDPDRGQRAAVAFAVYYREVLNNFVKLFNMDHTIKQSPAPP